ncbi:MAG: virulence RhuM family protein [Methanocorpusculum sp.]|nr:virulence RhuM family protein [Methanocorpusculum sp.]
MTPQQNNPDKTGKETPKETTAVVQQEHPIILYQIEDANISVNVRYSGETFWLTQKAMAELFDCTTDNISLHLKHIFEEEELDKNSVTEESSVTASDGKTYKTKFYSLDAVIAAGYRINSKKATRFRQWATKTLKEYITKGFVLNDDMLKNGKPFGKDYFDELLERIREIRASERRAYQKITDLFQQCSSDYDKESDITKEFYATIQNKLHFAATGKTAAELISERADANHPTMGLTTWKDAPGGKIYQSDITTAKNYLNEAELKRLNRLVTMFIDYAELMAEDNIVMTMQDWAHQTDRFLKNNRRNILTGAGHITRAEAEQHAREEYKAFRKKQDKKYISDFDREMEKYYKGKEN